MPVLGFSHNPVITLRSTGVCEVCSPSLPTRRLLCHLLTTILSTSDMIAIITEFKDEVDSSLDNLLRLQDLCADTIAEKWKETGFSHAAPETVLPPFAEMPIYRARKDGADCLLCMALPAPNPMELHSVAEAQCKFAESAPYSGMDVYATSLVLWGKSLVLLHPVCLRKDGEWLTEEAENEQFLPLCRRDERCNLAQAMLGDAYHFKLFAVLMPYLAQHIRPCKFRVTGLFEKRNANPPLMLGRVGRKSAWTLLLKQNEEKKAWEALRPIFYDDQGPLTELELVRVEPEYPELGIAQLMHRSGRYLYAESAEAIACAADLPTSRRYLWTLSLVAEKAADNAQEIRITEGPLFEISKAEYIKEEGHEPPEDFAVTVSTAQMRSLHQPILGEDAAFTKGCGVITAMEDVPFSPFEVPGGHCLRAQVLCMEDDDEFILNLYLPPAAIADFLPQVGDNIHFCGTLFASPDLLCETETSWQDAAEVAEQTEERHLSRESMETLRLYGPHSLGYAVAAAAFVRAGWQIEVGDSGVYSRHKVMMVVARQQGELAVVFVDTVVNGQSPAHPCTEFRQQAEAHFRGGDSMVKSCYFCTVNLDYNASADRYSVSMTVDPPCEGVENRLLYTAPAYPEKEYDEATAAELFRDAMAEGLWGSFAACLREEMSYVSGTIGSKENSKIDFLRYMTERVEWWKTEETWPYFRFATGTIVAEGKRRPCMATSYLGIPTSIVVFDLRDGMVERMRTLPYANVPTYIEETTPVNHNELEENTPRPLCENVVRPPHGAAEPVDIKTLRSDTEDDRAVLHVLGHLEDLGTPAVCCAGARAPFPHLWYRDAMGALCYGIVARSEHLPEWWCRDEDIIELPPDVLRYIVGSAEYPHLKQLNGYKGYLFLADWGREVECFPIEWD